MASTTSPSRTAPAGPTAPASPPTPAAGLPGALLLSLALLAAVAPLATDLYLSGFPAMAADLGTSSTAVQLTLTAFLVGLAVGQLVFGPLSDRFGRRTPLLVGSAVFIASSAVAALAPSAEILIAARLVQGLSGAAGMVIGRAVVTDRVQGTAAAKALSLMMVVSGIAPVIAPLLGSVLVETSGWRGALVVLVATAVLMLVAVLIAIPETLPRSARRLRTSRGSHAGTSRDHSTDSTLASGTAISAPSPWRALASRRYLGTTATFVLAFATMMAYISASPFLYQDLIGVSPLQYGLLFGLNALGLAAVSALSSKLLDTFSAPRLVLTGLLVLLGSCLAVGALVLLVVPAGFLTIPLFTAVSSLGLVFGTTTALALGAVTGAAGTASAVLGAAQFTLAALVSPLVGIGGETSAAPLAIVMTTAAALALAAFAISGVARRRAR